MMSLMIVGIRQGMKANLAFLEIGQYWIDNKGNVTAVGFQRTLSHYINFSFSDYSRISCKIKKKNYLCIIMKSWIS